MRAGRWAGARRWTRRTTKSRLGHGPRPQHGAGGTAHYPSSTGLRGLEVRVRQGDGLQARWAGTRKQVERQEHGRRLLHGAGTQLPHHPVLNARSSDGGEGEHRRHQDRGPAARSCSGSGNIDSTPSACRPWTRFGSSLPAADRSTCSRRPGPRPTRSWPRPCNGSTTPRRGRSTGCREVRRADMGADTRPPEPPERCREVRHLREELPQTHPDGAGVSPPPRRLAPRRELTDSGRSRTRRPPPPKVVRTRSAGAEARQTPTAQAPTAANPVSRPPARLPASRNPPRPPARTTASPPRCRPGSARPAPA